MSLSVDDDVREPDLSAVVRIVMLVISVIFGFFRAKIEDLLKGRPEHMELLQSVYRELSVAALISMLLSLIGTGSITSDISRLFGIEDGNRVNASLHSLHIVFLMGIMLYMGMCALILTTLRIVVNTLKRWDDETIHAGIAEMQELLDHIPVDVTFPVLRVLFRSLRLMYARRKLAWLMYREVFFMQFVSESEESPSDFSYVRYLRLAIYEVCLQLTEIRGTAGVIVVVLILIRWARVRYLDLNSDVGFYGAVAWELLSFAYVYHVNSRIMKLYREYLIDTKKFTRKNLQDFRDRVERFGLHESQQTHDTSDVPRIVVDRDQDSVANSRVLPESVLDSWIQYKVQRERRKDQLVRMAASKFVQLAGSKAKYKSNQVAPESNAVSDNGSTLKPEDGYTRQSDRPSYRKMSVTSLNSVGEHSCHLPSFSARERHNVAEFRNISAKIAGKLSAIRRQIRTRYRLNPSRENVVSSKTAGESRPGESSTEPQPCSQDRLSRNESRTVTRPAPVQPSQSTPAASPRRSSDGNATRRMIPHSMSSNTPRNGSIPDNNLRVSPKWPQDSPALLAVQSAAEEPPLPLLALDSDAMRRNSQPALSSPNPSTGRKGSQNSMHSPRRLSLSHSAANPLNATTTREKVLTPRRASQNSENENSVSRSASNREESPSALESAMEDPLSTIGSRGESPSKRGSVHQDGHPGFRQSVRKSLKKPADEIAKKHDLDRRRSTSLKDHIRQASEKEFHFSHVTNKKHLYTFRLIASFGGSKLEQAQGDDLENSFRWWASPGAEGLMTILHSIVLIDTLMFGLTLYLLGIGNDVGLLAILIPLLLKIALAPIMIHNYTMITSSGSMARIELLLLAIHQKLEEDAMAKLSRAEQTRLSGR